MNPVFDELALNYDEEFTSSEIGKLQRNRVYHFLDQILNKKKNLNILEINCGTGIDANHMASFGHSILATDNSESMIKKAQLNNRANKKVSIINLDLKQEFTLDSKYDLVFSNFGGLNCLSMEELNALSTSLFKVLKPNGIFIAVIMGRNCIWERMYFSLKGEKQKAKRRKKEVVRFEGKDNTIDIRYYNPKELTDIFKSNFKVQVLKPIGVSIPPSYLNRWFSKHQSWLKILALPEKWGIFGSLWSDYADHYYIQFNKRNTS